MNKNPYTLENEHIIVNALRCAMKHGFDYGNGHEYCAEHFKGSLNASLGTDELPFYVPRPHDYLSLFFSHDFAKAFYGDRYLSMLVLDESGLVLKDDEQWKTYLQLMVVCDNPIKFIEDHTFNWDI